MKKYLLLFILPLFLFFSSCNLSDGPTDTESSIFPTVIGNYWIYERYPVDSLGNVIGTAVYDTLSVTGKKVINGQDAYEMLFKRNGLHTNYALMNSSVYHTGFYGQAFIPLFSARSECNCEDNSSWKDFTHLKYTPWKYNDSISGKEYPSVVFIFDKNGNIIGEQIIMSKTAVISNSTTELYGFNKVEIDNKSFDGITFKYSGKSFLRLISPKNAQLVRPNGYQFTYYENDRVVKSDDLLTYITFVKSIGIVEIFEDYAYGYHLTRFKSKLIKYNLVK